MSRILDIIREFGEGCACGREHKTTVRDVQIGSGIMKSLGEILRRNSFSKNLILVADRNTLAAADGILDCLDGFEVELKLYDELRIATMELVCELEDMLRGRDVSVLSVGTGSVNDVCRLASARADKLLCIFATAPSMDGFASYGAPIVSGGFKATYDAKSPEVIVGDTKILAAAPTALKSSGFGDMIAKYVGLIDWQISTLLTGEYYCDRVAALTRAAVDELMLLSDRVTERDEYTAGLIFESLLKTGIAMSFTQNSRPASGAEHVVAHLIECVELRDDIVPNLHGEDVGVCTLATLKLYSRLAELDSVEAHADSSDFDDVYAFYGSMADDVRRLNEPTVTDKVDPRDVMEKWGEVCRIIRSVPSYDECYEAMRRAGCKLTVDDIGKSEALFDSCMRYSPYMRYRLTLLRLLPMIETPLDL